MKNLRIKNIVAASVVVISTCLSLTACSTSQETVIEVSTKNPGKEISEEMLGLSYETKDILPGDDGVYYFRPENEALLKLINTIGVKNIRIGGNSVDASNIPIPGEEDIHSFFKFAKAANVKVIYSFRLKDGDPEVAKSAAKIIYENYKDLVESFAIGNEPDYYADDDEYLAKWGAIYKAILEVYPDAVFSGPDQNPDVERLNKVVDEFGAPKGRLMRATQHSYPFGCSYKNPEEKDVNKLIPFEQEPSREKMLDSVAYHTYQNILSEMQEATANRPISIRLSETNSYWFSGLKGVSDSFASALWGLDYLHWWASHGIAGINFHTGDKTGGTIRLVCRYAAFSSLGKGYEVRTLAYGMKLFSMGSKGNILPVEIISSFNQNMAAYATLDQGKTLFLTLINKDYKNVGMEEIKIKLDGSIIRSKVEFIELKAENNDISVGSDGVTLGGAAIETNGVWDGKWQKLPTSAINDNEISISVSPASAILIKATIE